MVEEFLIVAKKVIRTAGVIRTISQVIGKLKSLHAAKILARKEYENDLDIESVDIWSDDKIMATLSDKGWWTNFKTRIITNRNVKEDKTQWK